MKRGQARLRGDETRVRFIESEIFNSNKKPFIKVYVHGKNYLDKFYNIPLLEEITPYFEGFTCKGSHILHFSNISTTMHIRAVT